MRLCCRRKNKPLRQKPFPGKTVYGLTGGVGAGKSSIMALLKENYGAYILEADRVAEEVMLPGGASYGRLAALLGADVLAGDGRIDRKKLSDRIFADPELLQKVNAIVHPDTRDEVVKRIAAAKESLVIYEAALPAEAHFDELCDAVLYVWASEETRTERLMNGRGYSREKCEAIMRQQLSEDAFRRIAAAEINNDGSPEEAAASLALALKKAEKRIRP